MPFEKGNTAAKTHGFCTNGRRPEWISWKMMHQRCYNPSSDSYLRYGAVGIKVCPRWHSFDKFYADMGDSPGDNFTLGRRDHSRGYCKSNCRWESPSQQARARSTNHILEIEGEKMTIADWADRSGVSRDLIYRRVYAGWEPNKAVFTKARRYS